MMETKYYIQCQYPDGTWVEGGRGGEFTSYDVAVKIAEGYHRDTGAPYRVISMRPTVEMVFGK